MTEKHEILDKFFSGNKQIPTVPVLYLKFNKLISDSTVSNKTIADLLMKDQSMVVKLLRLSNSALYSRRKEVTSLSNAITFLGLDVLKNLVLQISLVRAFDFEEIDFPGFSINTFWEHSLGTAYFSSLVTKRLGIPANEEQYLGGLLHDIGKLVIFQFYPKEFVKIIRLQANDKLSDIAAEEQVLGVNHQDIGVYFAEAWKFNENIINTIKNHHGADGDPPLDLAVVQISNLFAKAAGLCFPWDSQLLDIVAAPSWQILSHHAGEKVNVEEMVVFILDEADDIKDSVRELLSNDE